MAKIQTLEQMRDYVKLMCGAPVVQIEVDDLQIDQCIEDSIDILVRRLYEEASYLDRIIVTLSAGVDSFYTSAMIDNRTGQPVDNVHDIYDFTTSFGTAGSINSLFSPSHMLLYQSWVTNGQYPSGPQSTSYDGGMMIMSNYNIALMSLKEISNTFTKMYTLNYLPASQRVLVAPTPKQDVIGVLSLYKRETSEYLYNHILLKQLAVAKVKKIWGGLNVGKYDVTLPDGARINYSNIYDQGVREEEYILERLDSESAPVDFFIA